MWEYRIREQIAVIYDVSIIIIIIFSVYYLTVFVGPRGILQFQLPMRQIPHHSQTGVRYALAFMNVMPFRTSTCSDSVSVFGHGHHGRIVQGTKIGSNSSISWDCDETPVLSRPGIQSNSSIFRDAYEPCMILI